MKKLALAVALFSGIANAQSTTATTTEAASAATTSTIQAPAAPSAVKLSLDLEMRNTLPQKNASGTAEANAELDVYVKAKLNKRHTVAALTTLQQNYDDKNQKGANQSTGTQLPYDPFVQYSYRFTNPDVKDHSSSLALRYYVPTSAGSVANKNDGSLRVRYDYVQTNNIGPVGLTVIYSPFIQKYFNGRVEMNQEAIDDATKRRNEFALGNQLVLSWEYKKLYVDNAFDVRLLAPMRTNADSADQTPANTYAYFETYVGYYLNQANTFSVFALYVNETDMIDGAGYEYPVTNGDSAVYSVGLRGSF